MKKEIVFGPSTYGSLRIAQFTGVGNCPDFMICDPNKMDESMHDKIEQMNHRTISEWYNSTPVGGRAEDIICLEYDLEYGDISEKIPSSKRYQSIYQMVHTMYPENDEENVAKDWADSVMKKNRRSLRDLNSSIKNDEPIRIWYSSSPSEINGFYWLMYYLDSKKHYTNVSNIFLPPYYWDDSGLCIAWPQLKSCHWSETLYLEKEMSEAEIKSYSERWKELRKENSPLRLMISGNLVGLDVTFLDPFFYKVLDKIPETFKIARLVGDVMGESGLMLGDMPLFERVKALIANGVLELTEEWQERPMQTLVKKCRS